MTTQLPNWLNPAVMPPDELVDRIRAAAQAFSELESSIVKFAEIHADAISEYQSRGRGDGFPDSVWQTIDAITGYGDLHIRMMNIDEFFAKALGEELL
jgi:hypothetical protein